MLLRTAVVRLKHNGEEHMRNAFLVVAVFALLLAGAPANAEFYFGGYAGYGFPNDYSDIEGTGDAAGLKQSDTKMADTLILGGKAGYYFDPIPWLGVEFDVNHSNPHFKQQDVTVSGPGFSVPGVGFTGMHVSMWTFSFNAMLRYPGKTFQPYGGVGLAVLHATLKDEFVDDSATKPGLNAMAGLRAFLTENVALFVEGK